MIYVMFFNEVNFTFKTWKFISENIYLPIINSINTKQQWKIIIIFLVSAMTKCIWDLKTFNDPPEQHFLLPSYLTGALNYFLILSPTM